MAQGQRMSNRPSAGSPVRLGVQAHPRIGQVPAPQAQTQMVWLRPLCKCNPESWKAPKQPR